MNTLLLMLALTSSDPGQGGRSSDPELRRTALPVSGLVLLADGTQPDGGKKKKKKKGGEESEEERA